MNSLHLSLTFLAITSLSHSPNSASSSCGRYILPLKALHHKNNKLVWYKEIIYVINEVKKNLLLSYISEDVGQLISNAQVKCWVVDILSRNTRFWCYSHYWNCHQTDSSSNVVTVKIELLKILVSTFPRIHSHTFDHVSERLWCTMKKAVLDWKERYFTHGNGYSLPSKSWKKLSTVYFFAVLGPYLNV